jgi:hypothetical protein
VHECGIVGADARPQWQERPPRESLTGVQWRWDHEAATWATSSAARSKSRPAVRSTEERSRARGFTVRLLARIVRAGFAIAKPEIVKAGGRTLSMLRLTITDAGRRALAGWRGELLASIVACLTFIFRLWRYGRFKRRSPDMVPSDRRRAVARRPIEWGIRLVRSSSDLWGSNLPTAAMYKAS